LPEKSVAFQRWATFVEGMVKGRPANATVSSLSISALLQAYASCLPSARIFYTLEI
jgi:hypothetical protein